MQQFNLTEEDLSVTRADIQEMLDSKPKNKDKKDHVRQQLNGRLKKEAVDKVIADIDSYN